MPIDPVKIPQNVYIEDHIVGPLTLRQTLIMAAGGGFSYALYGAISKAYGGISLPIAILVWIPCALSILFALVKINDLSLMKICFLMAEKFQKPSLRTWTPRRGISINIRTHVIKEDTEKLVEHQKEAAKKQQTREKIKELSSILDQSAEPEVVEDVEQVRTATPATPTAEDLPDALTFEEDEPAVEKRPVDPKRIAVDHPEGEAPGGGFSDLSVFRDIFPQK